MGRVYEFWEARDLRSLRRLRSQGVTYPNIARMLNRTWASVTMAAKTYGISRPRVKADQKRRQVVWNLHRSGKSPGEITKLLPKELKCCRAQVYRDIKAMPHT